MSTALLMHPNINISYFDPDVLNIFPTIASQNIVAFNDNNNTPQNLNLAGTSNINLQALKDMNIGHGAANKLVISTGDNTGASNAYLSLSTDVNNRVILTDMNHSGVTLTSSNTLIGTTQLTEQTNFLEITSGKTYGIAIENNLVVNNDLGVAGTAYLQSNIYVQGNAYVYGNLTTQGKLLTNEMAIYKSAPSTADAEQVGYSWVIDENDRLELVKYTYFTGNPVPVTKKIATFGYNSINLGDSSDINYTSTKYANTLTIPTPINSMLGSGQPPQILQTFSKLDLDTNFTYDLSAYFSGATSFTLGSPATNLNITTTYFYPPGTTRPAPVTLLNSTTIEVNVSDVEYNFPIASISGNTLTVDWSGIGIVYTIIVIATNATGTTTSELIVNDILESS